MVAKALILAASALVAAQVAAAAPRAIPVPTIPVPTIPVSPVPVVGGAAVATLSDASPGASRVALTIRIRTELQCGRLRAAALDVRLPAEMRVPGTVARTDVRVSGKAPASAAASGSTVSLRLARAKRGTLICDVIGPGTVTIAFAAHAGLGNPAAAGSYPFSVVAGRQAWRGTLRVG